MKVLCVQPEWYSIDDQAKQYPVYGNVYTVVNSMNEQGILFYVFAELHDNDWFDADGFIPISDISETEMERNYDFKTMPV